MDNIKSEFELLHYTFLNLSHHIHTRDVLRKELKCIIIKIIELTKRLAEKEAELEALEKTSEPELPKKPSKYLWLSIGLAFLLALSIGEMLGIDFQNFKPNKTAILIIAIVASVFITLGVKLAILPQASALLRSKPKGILKGDRYDEGSLAEWVSNGQSAIPFSIAAFISETAIAGPGLIHILPFKLQNDPIWEVTMIIAAGLAVLVNIGMAWGIAIDTVRVERLYQETNYQEYKQKKQFLVAEIAAITGELNSLKIQDKELRMRLLSAENKAQRACEEWISQATGWIKDNPNEFEKNQQIHAQIQGINQLLNSIFPQHELPLNNSNAE